jgi:alpha/beta superfamily hydrolase
LVVYGEQDEYVRFPINDVIPLLQSHNSRADYEVISGANHSFDGYEKILSERILAWIKNMEN